MKKLAALCIAALGAALLVLGTAPGASAYPDLTCDLGVDRQTINGGDTFTATGVVTGADANTTVSWTYQWNGVTKSRTGATTSADFTAPEYKHTKVIQLTGTAQATLSGAARTCVHNIDIKVVGAQVSAPAAVLPNTGGPQLWILIAALLLLLGGGGALVASRRRSN